MKTIKKKIKLAIYKSQFNKFLAKFLIKPPYSNFIKDKVLIYPIVYNSDFLFTIFSLTPNQITLFNSLFISPSILFLWLTNHILYASILLYIRNWLDSVDGYIARKYNLTSPQGEIYHHVSDCIFAGMFTITFLHKLHLPLQFSLFISQFIIISGIIIDFSPNYKWLSTHIFGTGRNDNGFSTFIHLLLNFIIILF